MAGRGSGGGGGGGGGGSGPPPSEPVSTLDGAAPGDKDWNTYFCTYAYLYHQASLKRGVIRGAKGGQQKKKHASASFSAFCLSGRESASIRARIHAAPLPRMAGRPGVWPCLPWIEKELGAAAQAPTTTKLNTRGASAARALCSFRHHRLSRVNTPPSIHPAPQPISAKQKDMLEDHVRTGAYFDAMTNPANAACFAGKVVLDVGAGSGILAIFAAKAGAKKVYAVEATPMARHAQALVEANGLADTITVIQGTVESVQLPEKVDVIVSEWMGYLLVRESMLDSVLAARDAWLKPGGSLWPSHARLFIAPARSRLAATRSAEFAASMAGWGGFQGEVDARYGVDVSALAPAFRAEQRLYYLETSAWADVAPGDLVGPPACIAEFDLATVTAAELAAPLKGSFRLPLEGGEGGGNEGGSSAAETDAVTVDAFVGWFDVTFAGSTAAPAPHAVVLSTAPDEAGCTHWGQQVFPLSPAVRGCPGDSLSGAITISRRSDNHRLMTVELEWGLEGGSALARAGAGAGRRKASFQVE
jgi:type I protein arginine methyltransferase